MAMQHPRFLVRKHHLTMLLSEYEEKCVHRLITLEKRGSVRQSGRCTAAPMVLQTPTNRAHHNRQ